MKSFSEISQLSDIDDIIHLAIGVFDGVHLGHQAVINKSINMMNIYGGNVVVVTFDPYPVKVLNPEKAPKILTSNIYKKKILKELLNINYVLTIKFDINFSKQSGQEFINNLINSTGKSKIKSISVGKGWKFGKSKLSGSQELIKLGDKYNFKVNEVDIVKLKNIPISSTKIRKEIKEGNISLANELLSRPYKLYGKVIKGNKIGTSINFPTANFHVEDQQIPPLGVYAVSIVGSNNNELNGVANLGYRPTIEIENKSKKNEVLLEVYIFNLNKDIYNKLFEIEFKKFIRPEKKFYSLEKLKKQISIDIEEAKSIFK